MAQPLDASWLKLDRAEEHLRAFDEESGTWLQNTEFGRFDAQHDDDHWSWILKVVAEPPLRLSLILGDCLQNLRASLDYLAWQLVLANHRTPDHKTAFPIHSAPPLKGGFCPQSVHGMSSKMIALIETLQPYYGGKNPDDSLLFFLQKLSNRDKHNALNITVGSIQVTSFSTHVSVSGEGPVAIPTPLEIVLGTTLHDGAKVATYLRDDVPSDMRVQVYSNITGLITLDKAGPWSGRPVSRIAEDTLQFIRHVVLPGFQPFFH